MSSTVIGSTFATSTPHSIDDQLAVLAGVGASCQSRELVPDEFAAAALRWARSRGASRVILAVPVAPPEAMQRLNEEADDIVVLATPEPFYAVGQWYADFPQVSDEEVVEFLSRSAHRGEGG